MQTTGSGIMLKTLQRLITTPNPELSISATPVLVMLTILPLTILFVGEDLANIAIRTQWEITGLMILVWIFMGWRINSWNALVSKWLIIVMLVALVFWLRFSSINL